MNYRNWFSKERITNNDDFCFKSPITKPDHFRLVFTEFFYFEMKTIHPVLEIYSIAAQVGPSNMAASLQICRTSGFKTQQCLPNY